MHNTILQESRDTHEALHRSFLLFTVRCGHSACIHRTDVSQFYNINPACAERGIIIYNSIRSHSGFAVADMLWSLENDSQTAELLSDMRKCFVWVNSFDEMRSDLLIAISTWEPTRGHRVSTAVEPGRGKRGAREHLISSLRKVLCRIKCFTHTEWVVSHIRRQCHYRQLWPPRTTCDAEKC